MKHQSVESEVTHVFKLHVNARDHTEINFSCPWYGFRMCFKGPHNLMVIVYSGPYVLDEGGSDIDINLSDCSPKNSLIASY